MSIFFKEAFLLLSRVRQIQNTLSCGLGPSAFNTIGSSVFPEKLSLLSSDAGKASPKQRRDSISEH